MINAMVKLILITVMIFGPTLHLNAGCYISRTFAYPTYYSPVVQEVQVKKVVAVEYLALPVVVPAYSVGYSAPPVPLPTPTTAPVQSSCETKLIEVNAKLAALEARIGAALGTGTAPPASPPMTPAPSVPAPRQSSMITHCAKCHDASVSATKGGKLTMMNASKMLRLNDEQIMSAIRAIKVGDMPKDHQLDDASYSAVLSDLIGMVGGK